MREDTARHRGPYLRAFLRAMAQGHEAVRKDPTQGVKPLLAANPDLDPADTLAEVKQTIPTFFPTNKSRPWGYQDEGEWSNFGAWMLRNKLLSKPGLPISLTNEYLPGQGIVPANDPSSGD